MAKRHSLIEVQVIYLWLSDPRMETLSIDLLYLYIIGLGDNTVRAMNDVAGNPCDLTGMMIYHYPT